MADLISLLKRHFSSPFENKWNYVFPCTEVRGEIAPKRTLLFHHNSIRSFGTVKAFQTDNPPKRTMSAPLWITSEQENAELRLKITNPRKQLEIFQTFLLIRILSSEKSFQNPGCGTKKKLIQGDPRSDPLPFYIPFLAEKVPLSYTFHWKIMKGPFKYLSDRFPYPFIYFDS